MRREWKRRSFEPRLTSKMPLRSWKNRRCSGKKREKRVRFTCWSSASTWAKSVFAVRSRLRFRVMAYFRSPPTSVTRRVSRS
jgi:hypothetical protein